MIMTRQSARLDHIAVLNAVTPIPCLYVAAQWLHETSLCITAFATLSASLRWPGKSTLLSALWDWRSEPIFIVLPTLCQILGRVDALAEEHLVITIVGNLGELLGLASPVGMPRIVAHPLVDPRAVLGFSTVKRVSTHEKEQGVERT